MKSPRLAVGVFSLLACTLSLGGCSESPRKEPAPGDTVSAPAPPTAAPTARPTEGAAAAVAAGAAGPASAGEPRVPTASRDNGRGISVADGEFEHAAEEGATAHVHPAPARKGSLEGLGLDGNRRWTCREDRAYRPKGATTFHDSASTPLTEALNETAKQSAPMTLVMQHKNGDFVAALSATRSNGANKEAFLPGKDVPSAPLVLAFGGDPVVTTDAPLAHGYLQLFDKKGPVILRLRRLLWRATRGASCDEVEVDVHATIPFAQYGVTLHLAKGDKTIAELAGVAVPAEGTPEDGPPQTGEVTHGSTPISVHFGFKGAAAAFALDGGAR